MKRILIIEIDVTNIKPSWVVAVQIAEFEYSRELEKQVFVKRKEGDKIVSVPSLTEENNIFLSATEEIHE